MIRFRNIRAMMTTALVALLISASALHAADEHGGGHSSSETLMASVWVLIIFGVMLAILYPKAWKPIMLGLKKREERIRADIARAEQERVQAEATLKQYNDQLAGAEARISEMLAKAKADGERLASTIRSQAQQEAEEAKQRATRDIESSKKAAIREVYEQTATLATGVAEKILRRNLNEDDQRTLVTQSLDQLQAIK